MSNENKLNRKNLGLILVSNEKCEEQIPARPNKSVDAEMKEEMLRQFGLAVTRDFPLIETLSRLREKGT